MYRYVFQKTNQVELHPRNTCPEELSNNTFAFREVNFPEGSFRILNLSPRTRPCFCNLEILFAFYKLYSHSDSLKVGLTLSHLQGPGEFNTVAEREGLTWWNYPMPSWGPRFQRWFGLFVCRAKVILRHPNKAEVIKGQRISHMLNGYKAYFWDLYLTVSRFKGMSLLWRVISQVCREW